MLSLLHSAPSQSQAPGHGRGDERQKKLGREARRGRTAEPRTKCHRGELSWHDQSRIGPCDPAASKGQSAPVWSIDLWNTQLAEILPGGVTTWAALHKLQVFIHYKQVKGKREMVSTIQGALASVLQPQKLLFQQYFHHQPVRAFPTANEEGPFDKAPRGWILKAYFKAFQTTI